VPTGDLTMTVQSASALTADAQAIGGTVAWKRASEKSTVLSNRTHRTTIGR
jgi:hypothetical protein